MQLTGATPDISHIPKAALHRHRQRHNEMPKCYMTCNLFYADNNERLHSISYFFYGNNQKKPSQGINLTLSDIWRYSCESKQSCLHSYTHFNFNLPTSPTNRSFCLWTISTLFFIFWTSFLCVISYIPRRKCTQSFQAGYVIQYVFNNLWQQFYYNKIKTFCAFQGYHHTLKGWNLKKFIHQYLLWDMQWWSK